MGGSELGGVKWVAVGAAYRCMRLVIKPVPDRAGVDNESAELCPHSAHDSLEGSNGGLSDAVESALQIDSLLHVLHNHVDDVRSGFEIFPRERN